MHTRPATAKYPGRVGVSRGLAVVSARCKHANGTIERMREVDGQTREVNGDFLRPDAYLLPRQCCDVFDGLSENDDQDRRESVARMKGLLVDDLFDDGVLLVIGHPWSCSAAVRCHLQIRSDKPDLDRPTNETIDVLSGCWTRCLPEVNVALRCLFNADAVLGCQPVAEVDRDRDGLLGS